ncbi:MAG TPA: diacylglycerol kinase family protein [Pyrinomonadaceae bacterium]|nr:diacylglycerol kinase family protein [Pyrinomonadaceae bacterium]
MQSQIEVIVNQGSGAANGAGDIKTQIEEAFKANNLQANVSVAASGEDLMRLAEEAAAGDAEIVVAGGGDGTMSGVASKIIDTGKIFGILPLGTLNHFSKDLQIPPDLAEAARVIAEGNVQEVDVGEVNGQIFINNSSIGLYPNIVRRRKLQQRLGRGKWAAAFWAATRVLRRYPFLSIKLKIDGEEIRRMTPFLFVGNNEYEMDFFNIGTRKCLDDGKLSIYLLHRTGRAGLLMLALRSLFGVMQRAKDFESVCVEDFEIETRRKKSLLVAYDGEVSMMQSPLSYKIHPKALKVLVPKPVTGREGDEEKGKPSA